MIAVGRSGLYNAFLFKRTQAIWQGHSRRVENLLMIHTQCIFYHVKDSIKISEFCADNAKDVLSIPTAFTQDIFLSN
jgi:hypothetical protein